MKFRLTKSVIFVCKNNAVLFFNLFIFISIFGCYITFDKSLIQSLKLKDFFNKTKNNRYKMHIVIINTP